MGAATILGNPLILSKNSSSLPLSLLHTNAYYHHKTYKFTYRPGLLKARPIRSSTSMTLAAAPALDGLQRITQEKSTMVDLRALVTVKFSKARSLKELIRRSVEAATSPKEARGVVLQLVSKDVDPGKPLSTKAEAEQHQTYEVNFKIDPNFGLPGAIYVRSQHRDEFFLMSVTVEKIVRFSCRSWIQPEKAGSEMRLFFSDKACLPCQTPTGLVELRQRELKDLCGDGTGLRLPSDRIYDYDVYNDLGNPDKGTDYARPTLGGERSRILEGVDLDDLLQPMFAADVSAELPPSPSIPAYVSQRQEIRGAEKRIYVSWKEECILRNIIPLVIAKIYEDAIWGGLPDDEFGRRVLAGVNPVSIEKLKGLSSCSKLEPSIYGPARVGLKGRTHNKPSLKECLCNRYFKEFVVLEIWRKTYATNYLLFNSHGNLKPIAIELSLPLAEEKASKAGSYSSY
ncbi:Linoleate 13S-lipoxygenase 3-1, chloroplastic [Sesamum alatum]|uniref:Linoleate 13S-lipoxygenase 3-1, chloroplastic n=1 Tax=Sesamum alatum TaxID=300844 RepID=A0AAE2CEU2_9LAMI|nr:Linoleate 13S-lipoxygenase 3-1, chloroplastic [Sesamum alatum]